MIAYDTMILCVEKPGHNRAERLFINLYIHTVIQDEPLTDRLREALSTIKQVEEKRMFRGTCFMVNGKMCICANKNELMCRIGPDKFEMAVEMNGCRPMVHNGKTMTGFVFVHQDALKSKKEFDFWIKLCLDFNKLAKASKPKKKK